MGNPISAAYLDINEAALLLQCSDQRIIRMLEQGEINGCIGAEYESVFGDTRFGYVAATPEVILCATSGQFEKIKMKTPSGADAVAFGNISNVRVITTSLQTLIADMKAEQNKVKESQSSRPTKVWSDAKRKDLLHEHQKQKAKGIRNPTVLLAEKLGVSDSLLRRQLALARKQDGVGKTSTLPATPWDALR